MPIMKDPLDLVTQVELHNITFVKVEGSQNPILRGRSYNVQAKVAPLYSYPSEGFISVFISELDFMQMSPWELKQKFRSEVYRQLPDDFFPTWSPV